MCLNDFKIQKKIDVFKIQKNRRIQNTKKIDVFKIQKK